MPHLAVPLRLNGRGALMTLEQDSPDELAQCVAVLVATPLGSRVEVPDYGTPRGEFTGPDPAEIVAAVQAWEPRVDAEAAVTAGIDGDESVTAMSVQIRAHL